VEWKNTKKNYTKKRQEISNQVDKKTVKKTSVKAGCRVVNGKKKRQDK